MAPSKEKKSPKGVSVQIINRRNSAAEPTAKEDSLSWPLEDIRMLLSRMNEHVPRNDKISHQSRSKTLPWNNIAFSKYTGEECYKMWKLVLQRVRGFRFLSEVLFDAEGWVDRPWTNFYGSRKMNRHPECPQVPGGANSLYVKDNFPKVKEANPEMNARDVFKLISTNYKELSEKKKEKYRKKAILLKEEYERDLAIFLRDHPTERVYNVKNSKPKKLTAFNLYLESQLAKHKESDQTLKDLHTKIRKKWNNLKESKKLHWINKAEYLQKTILESAPSVQPKSLLTKDEKKISDKAKGKPSKPPVNTYALFSKIMFNSGELEEYESKERMKQIAARWKQLSSDEKVELNKKLSKEKVEYEQKLKAFYRNYPDEIEESPPKTSKTSVKKSNKVHTTSESSSEEINMKKRKNEINQLDKKSKKRKVEIIPDEEKTKTEETKEPKRPPSDPMKYFSKVMKKQKVKYSSEEELSEAWSNLTKHERKAYKKEHAELMEQYQATYEAYLTETSTKKKKKA